MYYVTAVSFMVVRLSYVFILCMYRCTTIPSRTKGKRKVQIRLSNCRALQSQTSQKPAASGAGGTGAGGTGTGGGGGSSSGKCPLTTSKPV